MTTVRDSSRSSAIVATVLLVLAAGAAASAHRQDEYLQAARLAIDPDRVQIALDLTPGIAVADRVLAEIDADADQSISPDEARAYASRVLSALAFDVDGVPLCAELVDSAVPPADAVRRGEGTTRVQAVARLPPLADGRHQLRYRNSYRPDISVYLANTLVPASDRVTVAAQRRDVDQRDLLVDYNLRGDRAAHVRRALPVGFTGALALAAHLWWRRRPREDA